MAEASFEVIGEPFGQGHKTAFAVKTKAGKVVAGMREGATPKAQARHATWRDAVSLAALEERYRIGRPLDGALMLVVRFRFPMPKSRPATLRRLGTALRSTRPDYDTLLRSIGDSCTAAGLVADDARFACGCWSKWEVFGDWTGAEVTIREVGFLPPNGFLADELSHPSLTMAT